MTGGMPCPYHTGMTYTTKHTPTYYAVRSAVRFAFVVVVAVVAFLIGKAFAGEPYPYRCDGSSVTAGAGDTLWSLAEQHCEGHIGHAVHDLYKVHADLSVGEQVTLNGERK